MKMRKMILWAVAVLAAASCTRGLDEAAVRGGDEIRFVVGDFPAFGGASTRAVGTEDPGKREWGEGDELLVEMTSKTLGSKYAAFTYNGSSWELTDGELAYKEDEFPTFPHVYYAPNYKWEAGKLILKDGKVAGTDEYIEGIASISPNGEAITVSFSKAERKYCRLRIATIPDVDINVAVEYITPAGSSERLGNFSYTLHSDAKGNAYLYGTFVKNSTVSVEYRNSVLAGYTFTGATDNSKSYALDATVISVTEGGMTQEQVNAIQNEIAAGKTNFNFLLAPDADEFVFNDIQSAIAEAGYRTINLILIGCEKIPAEAFRNCYWLKSIALPDVTDIGKSAFAYCRWLHKVVFGTHLTKVYGKNGSMGIFDGCTTTDINLVLSAEQKMMTGSDRDSDYVWTPSSSGQNYQDSDAHQKRQFIGYTFKSVTCGRTYPWVAPRIFIGAVQTV